MKHLEICRKYFDAFGREMVEKIFHQVAGRYAAGMVGEGSGCFGFDDEISRDHDFGPGFCIWLTDEDYDSCGKSIAEAYDKLPKAFMGLDKSNIIAGDRLGVMKSSDFYMSFTGCADIPKSPMDWFLISESNLAAVTNGAVFKDGLGEFSRIRRGLQEFYPKDVLLKKLEARCAVISQSGQYNYQRCLMRGDRVAASLSLARFTEAAISMAHLLHGRPTPFYKWAYKSLCSVDSETAHVIETVLDTCPASAAQASGAASGTAEAKSQANAAATAEEISQAKEAGTAEAIEAVCRRLAALLVAKGYAAPAGDFLQDYIPQLMSQIKDPQLASMHPMADCL